MGVARELTSWLAVGADFSKVAYRDIPFRFRGNPNIGPGLPRRFPDFGNFRIWYGDGIADYTGANFTVQARLSSRFTLRGFYTLSEITGNVLSGADDHDNGSAEALAKLLPDGQFVEVPGNHMSAVTKPELGRAIGDFLER